MMDVAHATPPPLGRYQRLALILGGIGIVLTAIGAFLTPDQFYRSYLVAFIFWLGVCLGSLAIAMLHYLAGGAWGAVIRRSLEAATRTLPLMIVLAIPFLFGLPYLYVWARPDVVAHDPLLQWKQPYLNVPFFWARTVFYIIVWSTMIYFFNKWSAEQDRTGDPAWGERLRRSSGLGLVAFGLTGTFGAIDWIMSLEPYWVSTIYGAMVAVGGILAAMAFTVAVVALLSDRQPLASVVSPKILSDLGSLLFAFVFIWTYLAFSQFLLIWYANLSEEIPWYIRRLTNGWEWVALAIAVLGFVVPFATLIVPGIKRNPRRLAQIAILLVVIRLVDLFWLVAPPFSETGLHLHWLDIAAPVGVGGLWIAFYLWNLQRRPLVPLNDPKLPSPVGNGHGEH